MTPIGLKAICPPGNMQNCFDMKIEIEDVEREIRRRLSFVKDELIGQSPEDLERHWRLMGAQDAFNWLLKWCNDYICDNLF